MGKRRKQRRQSHGSARHRKQTDCWYYTLPGTRKRVPLFDEDVEESARGMMWRVYSSKTDKTRKIPVRPEVADLVLG